MGLWKGKKGSSVFYSIWNSNNKEKQGIREYRAEVRNPQSDGQADQRARLLPAQRIKGALRDIVSRSFQGIPYGSKSRLEFIRQAMRLKEGYPFLTKGYQEPVPGRYIISKGTLRQVSLTYAGTASSKYFETSLKYSSDVESDTTIGDVSATLLAENSNLVSGDQITLVGCICSLPDAPDSSIYEWLYYSFYLDEASTTPLSDLPGWSALQLSSAQEEGGNLYVAGVQNKLCAAAVIVSRLDEDGMYLRSTAQLELADYMSVFFTPAQAAVTRASYQTGTTQNSTDWPVEEDTRGGGSSVTDGLYTLSGLTGDRASLNGRKCKVRINTLTGTPTAVYVLSGALEGALVSETGSELIFQAGSDYSYLVKADVPALASLPSVVYS